MVDPEGEPGDEDDHDAGEVHGDEEVAELPGEDQVHLEAAVVPGGGLDVAVVLAGPAHLEASRETHVGGELDGRLVLPDVDHVRSRQSVCRISLFQIFIGWSSYQLTAGEVEVAGLLVEGEQLEAHVAGGSEGDPDQEDGGHIDTET